MATVLCDDREPDTLLTYLDKSTRITVEKTRLPVGDYVGGNVAIERKTPNDLINSLRGQRLFRQLADLKDNYEQPVLILHGDPREALSWTRGRAQRAHYGYCGALAAAASMGVSVLPAFDDKEFRAMVGKLAEEDDGERDASRPVTTRKGNRSMREVRSDVLCAVRGIGRNQADSILDRYGTVAEVMRVAPGGLLDIDGIGDTTALRVADALKDWHEDYVEKRTALTEIHGVTWETALSVLNWVGQDEPTLERILEVDGVGEKTAEKMLAVLKENV